MSKKKNKQKYVQITISHNHPMNPPVGPLIMGIMMFLLNVIPMKSKLFKKKIEGFKICWPWRQIKIMLFYMRLLSSPKNSIQK